jgi:hypothetical protein
LKAGDSTDRIGSEDVRTVVRSFDIPRGPV